LRKRIIAVIGAGKASAEEKRVARAVGADIARRGAVLLCGGLGGVMDAACAGATSEGGLTIGLLPGTETRDASPDVQIAIPTGMGEARNYLVATGAEGVIAVGGSLGTLSELAFALKKRLPVAALGSWRLEKGQLPADVDLYEARDAADAVMFVLNRIEHK
jgi:uncharacterized protein (TIGR00725 family)